jgi:hypothetical protein
VINDIHVGQQRRQQRLVEITLNEREALALNERRDVALLIDARVVVRECIHAPDLVPGDQQMLTEMRPDEAGRTGDERDHAAPPSTAGVLQR